MIGRIEETSASFEARSAPRSYPTKRDHWRGYMIDDDVKTAAINGESANTFQVARAPKITGVTKQNVRNPRKNRSQIMKVVAV
jgi:hypothetical protein